MDKQQERAGSSTSRAFNQKCERTTRHKTVSQAKKNKIKVENQNYGKPLQLGWTRELVYRSQGHNGKRLADVYYHSPLKKKLRSLREVSKYLHDDLVLADFTFSAVVLGIDPAKEIVRCAIPRQRVNIDYLIDLSSNDSLCSDSEDTTEDEDEDIDMRSDWGYIPTFRREYPQEIKEESIEEESIKEESIEEESIEEVSIKEESIEEVSIKEESIEEENIKEESIEEENIEEKRELIITDVFTLPSKYNFWEGSSPTNDFEWEFHDQDTSNVHLDRSPDSEVRQTPGTEKCISKDKKPLHKPNLVDISKEETTNKLSRRKPKGPNDVDILLEQSWTHQEYKDIECIVGHRPKDICSVECKLALGILPTMQCVQCKCLFHPECCGLKRMPNKYICSSTTPTKSSENPLQEN